jgi:hypothetical protein
MSALGALLGIWLGLVLTTEPALWPKGLSFAQAGPGFENGWRWMYAVGALLALMRSPARPAARVAALAARPGAGRGGGGGGRRHGAHRVVSSASTCGCR